MPTRVSCRFNGVISYTGLLKANLLLYFGLPQKSYLARHAYLLAERGGIGRLGIPPFIVSLAGLQAYRGLALSWPAA